MSLIAGGKRAKPAPPPGNGRGNCTPEGCENAGRGKYHPGTMPYAMCPVCGNTMHLNVGDPVSWYATRHPDLPKNAHAPEPCFHCFSPLVVGDSVTTRRLISDSATVEPEQHGVIQAILPNADFGSLYFVSLESGAFLTCPRQALRKRKQ